MLVATWERLGEEGLQIPIAALLVLLLADDPTLYAEQLLGEGLIGGLVAAVVNVVVIPPLQVGMAERALVRLRRRLGDLVDDMSAQVGGLAAGRTAVDRPGPRARRPLNEAREAVRTGDESTRFNPRGRRLRHVPPGQRKSFESLENVTLAVRDLATSLSEAADPEDPALHLNEVFRPALARALRSVAEAITAYGSPRSPRTPRRRAGRWPRRPARWRSRGGCWPSPRPRRCPRWWPRAPSPPSWAGWSPPAAGPAAPRLRPAVTPRPAGRPSCRCCRRAGGPGTPAPRPRARRGRSRARPAAPR